MSSVTKLKSVLWHSFVQNVNMLPWQVLLFLCKPFITTTKSGGAYSVQLEARLDGRFLPDCNTGLLSHENLCKAKRLLPLVFDKQIDIGTWSWLYGIFLVKMWISSCSLSAPLSLWQSGDDYSLRLNIIWIPWRAATSMTDLIMIYTPIIFQIRLELKAWNTFD